MYWIKKKSKKRIDLNYWAEIKDEITIETNPFIFSQL